MTRYRTAVRVQVVYVYTSSRFTYCITRTVALNVLQHGYTWAETNII